MATNIILFFLPPIKAHLMSICQATRKRQVKLISMEHPKMTYLFYLDRIETAQHHHHFRHHSTSRPESLTDAFPDKPKILKFNSFSHSKNPQLSDHNPMPTTSGERSGEKKKKDPLKDYHFYLCSLNLSWFESDKRTTSNISPTTVANRWRRRQRQRSDYSIPISGTCGTWSSHY